MHIMACFLHYFKRYQDEQAVITQSRKINQLLKIVHQFSIKPVQRQPSFFDRHFDKTKRPVREKCKVKTKIECKLYEIGETPLRVLVSDPTLWKVRSAYKSVFRKFDQSKMLFSRLSKRVWRTQQSQWLSVTTCRTRERSTLSVSSKSSRRQRHP